MSLFDFFKKKEKKDNILIENVTKSDLFQLISKYSEYLVRFVIIHQDGSFAPISAYETNDGKIIGFLYIIKDEGTYSLSADKVIENMIENFEQKLINKEIKSYTIFYHSQYNNDNNHKLSRNSDELKAISIAYNSSNGLNGKIGLPYQYENNKVNYHRFKEFSEQENNIIFSTKIQGGIDYFQDKEYIQAPFFENEIGITVTKSNTKNLSNTWSGVFGFETYKKPNGGKVLMEYWALAMTKPPRVIKNDISISEIEFSDVLFKSITISDNPISILPSVKTEYIVSVENKEIDEWENSNNLEAIVSGNGKDTFGVWYLATDYAENREQYLTEKKLNINISGIAFVVDLHEQDYTAYLPSQDLPNYACFDFIGVLEDFKETRLLEDKSIGGYILKVKLITNPEMADFFTIDIFANIENMRMTNLSKGMKISGMFQMLGQIAKE